MSKLNIDHKMNTQFQFYLYPIFLLLPNIKNVRNDKCLYHLVEKINDLQNVEVDIKLPGKNLKVKFILGLVADDNLGINTVLGFSRSFHQICFALLLLYCIVIQ